MKIFLVFILLLLSFRILFAQTITASDSLITEGAIVIIKDYRIDSLIERQNYINNKKPGIMGYRIQIYFGSQRNNANNVKAEFLQKYPDIKVYLMYQQPNYKIRIGDFRTRLEAHKLYLELLNEFHTVFIVPDEISLPEL